MEKGWADRSYGSISRVHLELRVSLQDLVEMSPGQQILGDP